MKAATCSCGKPVAQDVEHAHIDCQCDGWARFREGFGTQYFNDNMVLAVNRKDEDDYELCRYCGLIRDFPEYLVTCTECGKKFKGPRKYFPIDYECENCG